MGFEPVEVKSAGELFRPLEAGEVSIAKTGFALFLLEDLLLVNIADQAALLADSGGTLRIALRRPRLPEDEGCVAEVRPLKRRDRPVRGRMNVNLASAIRQLGLTLAAAGGRRYELTTHRDLLIVNLASPKPNATKRQNQAQ